MKNKFLKAIEMENYHEIYKMLDEIKKFHIHYIVVDNKTYSIDYDNWEYMARAEEVKQVIPQKGDVILNLDIGRTIEILKRR